MWTTLARNRNYAVNQRGEIYSIRKSQRITPKRNHDGYLRIQLHSAGQCEYVGIHRLIAETFLPNSDNKPFVNHIDGNRQNNHVSNLEWCTQSENIRHAVKTGTMRGHLNRAGIRVRQLTPNGVLVREFPSQMQAERELGISHTSISYAIKHSGTAGGFKWEVA